MIEVQMGVHDDVDAVGIQTRIPRMEARVEVRGGGMQLGEAGVDEHARIRVLDDVHVDRHPVVHAAELRDLHRDDRDHAAHRAACRAKRAASPSQMGTVLATISAKNSFSHSAPVP